MAPEHCIPRLFLPCSSSDYQLPFSTRSTTTTASVTAAMSNFKLEAVLQELMSLVIDSTNADNTPHCVSTQELFSPRSVTPSRRIQHTTFDSYASRFLHSPQTYNCLLSCRLVSLRGTTSWIQMTSPVTEMTTTRRSTFIRKTRRGDHSVSNWLQCLA
ncbi:hypothetical protein BDW02DRAFT_414395 [Decorospora gaudefroyi]|uniref:Uncharacterized protein n=1 Tax=Decorospora gaudefroyi TaxID=184978 RepID=A0A6A5KT17_9PLEO|nr:hypothetical protein BDW02DRAFT_414395 [Decorospora gaudefroyi]